MINLRRAFFKCSAPALLALASAACARADNPMVDVQAYVPDAVLDLRYATPDNFLHQPVYPAPAAFLRKSAAVKLAKAAQALRRQGYRLRLYDCYRPASVQWRMWKLVPDSRYVADPRKGSAHNRGGAVDLSLATAAGGAVEMPSGFDDFTERAWRDDPKASPAARRNLAILSAAMEEAGFKPLKEEWWHYEDLSTRSCPRLDLSFAALKAGAAAPGCR
jgi:D-alanyl-D-alanine dipeptidase